MLSRVLKTIKKYDMFSEGDSVAVGFSGGKDSVALLSALSALKDELKISITAVHINHNLRGEESARDEKFAYNFCKEKNIPFRLFSFDVAKEAKMRSLGTEECARELRYKAFESLNTDKIATAHTLSDSVETIIFNFIRGAGIKGISGIPPVRNNIVRPLIECTSDEVVHYLTESDLSFVTDSSNLTDEYTRNQIRHSIVPLLKGINPAFETGVLNLSDTLKAADKFIEKEALILVGRAKLKYGYSAAVLRAADRAVLTEAIRLILKNKFNFIPEHKHIVCICNLILNGGAADISPHIRVRVRRDILEFPVTRSAESYSFPLKEGEFKIPDGIIEVSLINCEQFENSDDRLFSFFADYDKIHSDLICRNKRAGDKFYDYSRGCTKTMKDFLNEKGVPPEYRVNYPVFEYCGEVVGTAGSAPDSTLAVKENTKNIIRVVYRGDFNE